jgi:RNAse (barnase) inhibitor barstar
VGTVWQVAIVLDDETDPGSLLSMMPVWAKTTPERRASAIQLRTHWDALWHPDPVFTLINSSIPEDPVDAILDLVLTVEEHHRHMTCVRLFGVSDSEALAVRMAEAGYFGVLASTYPGVGYARPVSKLADVPVIRLNAQGWTRKDDFYDAFFAAVRAPIWHGRNRDALNDSISTGGINEVEIPYRLEVVNGSKAGPDARRMLELVQELVNDIQADGCPVEMKIID